MDFYLYSFSLLLHLASSPFLGAADMAHLLIPCLQKRKRHFCPKGASLPHGLGEFWTCPQSPQLGTFASVICAELCPHRGFSGSFGALLCAELQFCLCTRKGIQTRERDSQWDAELLIAHRVPRPAEPFCCAEE